VVDSYYGDTQILDESRTQIAEADHHTPVLCGGWVSVENGWVTLQHRFGYRIHLGPKSFVRFMDDSDAIILYRGQMFAQAGGGMGELRILTPNARVRVSRASVITLFDPEEESTQLTTVDGKATFENRFDGTKRASIAVRSGFASTLDFKLMRVVPSAPKIVATHSLRAKLKELNVPQRQSERALAVARNRQKELFAAFDQSENENVTSKKARSVVSEKISARVPASTESRGTSSRFDSNDYLLRKTLGGSKEGMKLLHTSAKKRHHAPQKARVQVEDPEAELMARQKSAEDQERRRLIEELSKIHSD
jgi:hypothetical protein